MVEQIVAMILMLPKNLQDEILEELNKKMEE